MNAHHAEVGEKLFASCFSSLSISLPFSHTQHRRCCFYGKKSDCRDYDDNIFFFSAMLFYLRLQPLSVHLHVAFIIRQAIIVKIFASFTIRWCFLLSSLEDILLGTTCFWRERWDMKKRKKHCETLEGTIYKWWQFLVRTLQEKISPVMVSMYTINPSCTTT